MYDCTHDLITMISSGIPPKFLHPVGRISLCLGTSLLENISLERRLGYNEYRRKKTVSSLKRSSPFLPLEFLAVLGKEAFVWGMP